MDDVDALVARANAAQRAFEAWSEQRVDALLGDIATCIADHARELAEATVLETGLGNVPDKIQKNRLASLGTFASLAGQRGSGVVRVDEQRQLVEIASAMGVVFGLVPRTHPVATFVFKVLIALKARNALIVSCHRQAQGVANMTGELVRSVLEQHGAPAGLVQWLRGRTDRETTSAFMRHPGVAFILATGGEGMVRAAYSSGTPAIGVGPGNAPTWVCADADLDRVAAGIIASKSYDNGMVCAAESGLIVDAAIEAEFIAALSRHGAAVLDTAESQRFTHAVFDPVDRHVRRELHGQSAGRLALVGGVRRSRPPRLIVVPATPRDIGGPLGREKLAPVVSLFSAETDDAAIALSQRLLASDGAGHTAIIHTKHQQRIDRFSRELRVSRVLVNVPGTHGSLGLGTGLPLSMTLGTGTFGGTSTTASVGFTHLLNIKRVAYATQNSETSR
jgi:acyl-CoA reductase-like NAD-dependent aldehyde dehydrogenase